MNRAERRLATPHIGRRTVDNSRIGGTGRGLNAHKMVANLAVEMAHECYEAHMSAKNGLWREMRRNLTEKQARIAFVAKIAPTLLEDARLALTDCLTMPDDVMPKAQKDEIADVLIKDSDMRANRLIATDMALGSGLVH